MEEKIKAELKKRGLDESLWTKIKVDKEEQIEEAVYDLKLQTDVQKHVQKELDQAVTKAVTTREENLREEIEKELKEKYKIEEPPEKDDKPPENIADVMAQVPKLIQDELTKALKPLTETIGTLSKAKTTEDRNVIILNELKEAELDPQWATSITAEKPEEIKEQVEGLKTRLSGIVQDQINKQMKDAGIPHTALARKNASDSLIEEIAERHNKGRSVDVQFKGKALEPEAQTQAKAD